MVEKLFLFGLLGLFSIFEVLLLLRFHLLCLKTKTINCEMLMFILFVVLVAWQLVQKSDDGGAVGVHSTVVRCWSTGQAIDPVPGACFIAKFISLAQAVPGQVYSLTVQNRGLKHQSFVPYMGSDVLL